MYDDLERNDVDIIKTKQIEEKNLYLLISGSGL